MSTARLQNVPLTLEVKMSITTKKCFKCSKIKPLSAFYKHNEMTDGHLGKCKECTKKDVRLHRDNNIERVKKYDRDRGFRGTRGKIYSLNKLKPKGNCLFCGSSDNLEKHHPDYSYPRKIIVLCRSCHRTTHAIVSMSSEEISDIANF